MCSLKPKLLTDTQLQNILEVYKEADLIIKESFIAQLFCHISALHYEIIRFNDVEERIEAKDQQIKLLKKENLELKKIINNKDPIYDIC